MIGKFKTGQPVIVKEDTPFHGGAVLKEGTNCSIVNAVNAPDGVEYLCLLPFDDIESGLFFVKSDNVKEMVIQSEDGDSVVVYMDVFGVSPTIVRNNLGVEYVLTQGGDVEGTD